jgi:hypothetical protein
MRTTIAALAGAALLLGGCSLTIDPNSVPPPPPPCVSTGCGSVICGGTDNCGTVCGAGSGCVLGHAIRGGTMNEGGGNASAAAGHAVQNGIIGTSAAGPQGAAAGHSISQGNISQ